MTLRKGLTRPPPPPPPPPPPRHSTIRALAASLRSPHSDDGRRHSHVADDHLTAHSLDARTTRVLFCPRRLLIGAVFWHCRT
ncbi:hypothetical protein Ga0100231_010530 [Opitutaceae bacterium TAV4]|nr:hypothetical protein Ga0100231_010530 [Opitutaceae bacterium TAV4]